MNIETLVQLGGQRWQKAGKDRVYFNNLPEWIGLCVSTYGTGNVSSASLNGAPISNSEARRILDWMRGCRFHYDATDGQFHWSTMLGTERGNYGHEIATAISAKAAEIEAQEPAGAR